MTVHSPPRTVRLPATWELQATRTPLAIAVRHGDVRLTYAELDARANRLARWMLAEGAGPGAVVAVVLGRSVDLVVAVLAVLKAGAAYVPIDASDPADRMNYIIGDAGAALVLTSSGLADAVREGRAPVVAVDELDLRQQPLDPVTDLERGRAIQELDAAYVIYTSGSTGVPKGVVVEHRALSAYLQYATDYYPSTSGLSFLHSSVSFDMAVTTLYAPLLSGGTVRLVDLQDVGPAETDRPTFLKITPSHLSLLHALPAACSPTEQLVIGGEMLTGTAVDAWRARYPGVTVVNEYGPTEAAVGCCVHVVAPGAPLEPGPVPIGAPTPQARLHLVDEQLRQVAEGATGELCIAGAQLARGYLGRPGQTAGRFVPDPFGGPGGRMYRTGDLARRRADGLLEYLGRRDNQVKVRGYRIELGEVESAVSQHEAVLHTAVVVRETVTGTKQLVAYVVPVAGTALQETDLRASLARRVPEYLTPGAFVLMSRLPLTTNGKLDVRALPDPDPHGEAEYTGPRTDAESALCELFAELTGVLRAGIDDDFFALGADSLLAARLVSLARRYGMTFSIRDVLRLRTVRRLLGTDGS
jgi:amino acid adenylation domain-containing protein